MFVKLLQAQLHVLAERVRRRTTPTSVTVTPEMNVYGVAIETTDTPPGSRPTSPSNARAKAFKLVPKGLEQLRPGYASDALIPKELHSESAAGLLARRALDVEALSSAKTLPARGSAAFFASPDAARVANPFTFKDSSDSPHSSVYFGGGMDDTSSAVDSPASASLSDLSPARLPKSAKHPRRHSRLRGNPDTNPDGGDSVGFKPRSRKNSVESTELPDDVQSSPLVTRARRDSWTADGGAASSKSPYGSPAANVRHLGDAAGSPAHPGRAVSSNPSRTASPASTTRSVLEARQKILDECDSSIESASRVIQETMIPIAAVSWEPAATPALPSAIAASKGDFSEWREHAAKALRKTGGSSAAAGAAGALKVHAGPALERYTAAPDIRASGSLLVGSASGPDLGSATVERIVLM